MENYKIKGFINYYLANIDGVFKLDFSLQTKEIYEENVLKRFVNPFNGYNRKVREEIITELIESKFNIPIYNLIPGIHFLEMVKTKSITNNDGDLDCIIVNGYKTNLGLFTKNNFIGGEFLVDETTFKTLCNGNKVLVNWANK